MQESVQQETAILFTSSIKKNYFLVAGTVE